MSLNLDGQALFRLLFLLLLFCCCFKPAWPGLLREIVLSVPKEDRRCLGSADKGHSQSTMPALAGIQDPSKGVLNAAS